MVFWCFMCLLIENDSFKCFVEIIVDILMSVKWGMFFLILDFEFIER